MMRKVIIFIGGCQFNRGSEAMVRGCVNTIQSKCTETEILLTSKDDNTGKSLNITGVNRYIKRYTYNRNNKLIRYFIGVLRYILHLKHITNWINHYYLLKECESADLIIIIGGDNYDKAYGAFDDMHSLNLTLRKISNGKMVYLNCSINPEEINAKIIDDLKIFDKVTARERITYNALRKYINHDKLEYYPDIAFCMDKSYTELPNCFKKGKVVGINLSPLILNKHYTKNSELVINEYLKIINYVLEELNAQVLLLPHVMNNTDLEVLSNIYNKYRNNENVSLVSNELLSAPQLKYIISNCNLYIGARTHSTIAAYSTEVPTLVLGYSVKSIGIARDIFGTEEGLVIPIQKLQEQNELLEKFKDFVTQSDNIRNKLQLVIHDYIQEAKSYSVFFDKLLN